MLENTERAMEKDNPDKLATQGSQDAGQINAKEYGRVNQKNQEKLAAQGTQDTAQVNVREYQMGNEKGQSRETWQHRLHMTQDT